MSPLTLMDPDRIRDLLAGEPDILGPAHRQEQLAFQNARCPSCLETTVEKRIAPARAQINQLGLPEIVSSPFRPDRPLAQSYGYCLTCGTSFDPQSGLILQDGPMLPGPHSGLLQE